MFTKSAARTNGAFTLIVVAIIALLAAILFPVFAQTREKARSATCFSNYHQNTTPPSITQSSTTTLMYEAEQDFVQAPINPTFRHS